MINKLVSIIIPVYNCEKYIERCLNSILNQTYKDIEIIIVNDGSTDETSKILYKISASDSRIKIINKKNEGVSIARNVGIDNANGEFITFVDADDWLEKNAIEKYMEVMKENQNIEVIRGRYYINDNEQERIENLYNLSNKLFYKEQIKNEVEMHFLSRNEPISNLVMLLFIRTEILKDKIYFNKELYMMEDLVFYFELFQNINNIYFLNIPVYHYFQNKNSATKEPKRYLKNITGILDSNRYLMEVAKKYKTYNKEWEKVLNGVHLNIIVSYLIIYMRYYQGEKSKKDLLNYLNSIENRIQELPISLKGIKIKIKIAVYLLKKQKYKLLYRYIQIFNYAYKILKH